MTKAVNFESKDIRTKDGNLKFGHIHQDQTKSSIMMQGQGGLEYITIDQSGATGKWITNRCRGRYQVKCGDEIKKGQPAFYIDAANGDIVIRTGGRIRMEAENIDMIANGGSDNKNGIITLQANEEVKLDSKKLTLNSKESCNIFGTGSIQISAKNILSMYAGTFEKMTATGFQLSDTTSYSSIFKS